MTGWIAKSEALEKTPILYACMEGLQGDVGKGYLLNPLLDTEHNYLYN